MTSTSARPALNVPVTETQRQAGRQGSGPIVVDVDDDQLPRTELQQRKTGCGPRTTCPYLHHARNGHTAQSASEAFGESPSVGVIADAAVCVEADRVDRADRLRLGAQLVEQGITACLQG